MDLNLSDSQRALLDSLGRYDMIVRRADLPAQALVRLRLARREFYYAHHDRLILTEAGRRALVAMRRDARSRETRRRNSPRKISSVDSHA